MLEDMYQQSNGSKDSTSSIVHANTSRNYGFMLLNHVTHVNQRWIIKLWTSGFCKYKYKFARFGKGFAPINQSYINFSNTLVNLLAILSVLTLSPNDYISISSNIYFSFSCIVQVLHEYNDINLVHILSVLNFLVLTLFSLYLGKLTSPWPPR